jgi:hypothetical protein
VGFLEWVLSALLVGIYLTAIFTVCILTFRKGHTILGIFGIFLPILWLIGAILPAKEGSRFDVDMGNHYANMDEYSR